MSNRGDRGAATTQLVLVTPAVLLFLLLVVQFALAWHAQHIAQTAASHALADTRARDGTTARGADTARRTLRGTGGRVLRAPHIEVTRDATSATVEIRVGVMPVIPGLHLAVEGHAAGPVERFTTPHAGD